MQPRAVPALLRLSRCHHTTATSPLFRKLLYRCHHRGMVENELILTSFLRARFSRLYGEDVGLLEQLLDEPDPSLYRWFTGAAPAAPLYEGSLLLRAIQEHTRTMSASREPAVLTAQSDSCL